MKHVTASSASIAFQEVYAFSHVETWLEDYAKSNRIPVYELTARVAELLRSNGTESSTAQVREMRRQGTRPHSRVEHLEVDSAASPKLQRKKRKITAAGLKAIRKAQKARWAKVHAKKRKGPGSYWDKMTQAERDAEMARRMKARKVTSIAKAA